MKINSEIFIPKNPTLSFTQRSAQTTTPPSNPRCGGSFFEPPRITLPRHFRFPSWARIPSSRQTPTSPAILPTRLNHSLFRFGYNIPADRGSFEDAYTGRLNLHESFLQDNDGPRVVTVGIRYETDHRITIELQTGGNFPGGMQLFTRLGPILERLSCQVRALPAGTMLHFDIPYPR